MRAIPLSDEDLFAHYYPKVSAYLESRAWRLVRNIEVFVGEVMVEVRRRAVEVQRPLDLLVEDATIYSYGRRWVALCRADGTVRQREALLAVGSFFNRVIRPFLAVITPQVFLGRTVYRRRGATIGDCGVAVVAHTKR